MTAATQLAMPEPVSLRQFTVYDPTSLDQPVPVVVPGELTMAQGVVITPVVTTTTGSVQFSGEWALTHVASGQVLIPTQLPPRHLHVMAAEMGRTDIDWTASREVLTGALRDQVVAALTTARQAAELAYLQEVK